MNKHCKVPGAAKVFNAKLLVVVVVAVVVAVFVVFVVGLLRRFPKIVICV